MVFVIRKDLYWTIFRFSKFTLGTSTSMHILWNKANWDKASLSTDNLDCFQRLEDDLHQPVSKALQWGHQGHANTSLGEHAVGGLGQGFPPLRAPPGPTQNWKLQDIHKSWIELNRDCQRRWDRKVKVTSEKQGIREIKKTETKPFFMLFIFSNQFYAFIYFICFLLLFKYTCLHFPPTTLPAAPIPTSHP